MATDPDESHGTHGLPPKDLSSENEFLKLKMMANQEESMGGITAPLGPELEKQIQEQVHAFESAYHAAAPGTFADTVGRPPHLPLQKMQQLPYAEQAGLVNEVLAFYLQHRVDVCFEFEYPPAVKYQFMVEELPEQPNHFDADSGMLVGVLYEEYHPNHVAVIEATTDDFMEGLSHLDTEQLKLSLSPVQVLPDGPYPTEKIIRALAEKFQSIARLNDLEYSIMQSSYDVSKKTEGGDENAAGQGYSEGLVKYTVVKKDGSSRSISGPFKFYFQFEYGCWSIMYIIFPGMAYPVPASQS
jgi:hypothetical protein